MNALNSAMYLKLSGGTALCSLVGGTVSPRIYYMQAPKNAPLPYVVYSLQSGMEGNDTAHRVKDDLYHVRGYATNALVAGSIDSECDSLLHMQPITVTGWQTIWLAREEDTELVENEPNTTAVYMAGGFYRLLLEKS
jgi:hypothetical protein